MNYIAVPGIPRSRNKPKELLFIHPERVKAAVMMYYNKPEDFLKLKSRRREDCHPRQVCIWLLKKYTKLCYREILGMIGKDGHADVIHACRVIENTIYVDRRVKAEIDSIVENF